MYFYYLGNPANLQNREVRIRGKGGTSVFGGYGRKWEDNIKMERMVMKVN